MLEEFIKGRNDLWLAVEKKKVASALEVIFRLKGNGDYLLHWGLAHQIAGRWQKPPPPVWPRESRSYGTQAVQTPFCGEAPERQISLRLDSNQQASFLVFDLFSPQTKRWENNGGQDYYLPLPELAGEQFSPADRMPALLGNEPVVFQENLQLDSGDALAIAVAQSEQVRKLFLLTNAAGPLKLHWGVVDRARGGWRLPPPEIHPSGTNVFDAVSVQTPFSEWQGLRLLAVNLPESAAPPGISFVLHQVETNQWLKHRGQNVFVPFAPPATPATPVSAIAERIIESEVGDHGWTLMHRFNLCHELIEDAQDSREMWATLFVWLRYSAIRQLDWQRNYNTKPRELAHAQDRLTARLATAFVQLPAIRDLIRQMLACLGRGGEGQRIRDEILQIMHRHHIKEVGGTWMEQWHQKLHNNTTPDDIVICEAYLAFLQSYGNHQCYHETLAAGGVTPERLASFERPINTQPEWHPQLREGLLHDFGNYLNLLKSVHSGTDLYTALNAGGHLLDDSERGKAWSIHHDFQNPQLAATELAGRIVDVRRQICGRLNHANDPGQVKELLYLDLALEQTFRTVIERRLHEGMRADDLLTLIHQTLENLLLQPQGGELEQCRRELCRLPAEGRFSSDWSLRAKAALDRLRRAIEAGIDRTYELLQPNAEILGNAFQADPWVVKLFSEEVVRGQPVFLLSMLLHHLDPTLRKCAKLGDWQIVSPSSAMGVARVVASFRAVQGERFTQPTVIIADKVHGDEEPPENVRAVITPSSVDLVSHVAVRARNASLLFATCFDRASFEKLKALDGRLLELKITASGDVAFQESTVQANEGDAARAAAPAPSIARAKPCLKALNISEFNRGQVGGKSAHLRELSGALPDWIRTPRSVALPFGVFDAVLADALNQSTAACYRELLRKLESESMTAPAATSHLAEMRRCLLKLELPEALHGELNRALHSAGLSVYSDLQAPAQCIKEVWASKWNDRAFFSRQARGFPHDAVQMAVLIQEVIPAEYAFVVHTVNPFSGKPDELYAEIVLGLGETLVGNYPGRALSFICPKHAHKPSVLAYPSKSIGLFGSGMIFRSDSNAEDLEGYAGAGLYDSVLLQPPKESILDYTNDKLIWDEAFRSEMLAQITRLGKLVEQAFGSPQDIEGAFANGNFHIVQTRPQVGLRNET